MASRIKEKDKMYQLSRYHQRRAFILNHLGGCCAECGSEEDLEIDHVDNKSTKIQISKNWSMAKSKLLKELQDCQLLCGKCHDEKSIQERGHTPGFTHGTYYAYRHGCCRCEECKEVGRKKGREYRRRYRQKQKEKAPSFSGKTADFRSANGSSILPGVNN